MRRMPYTEPAGEGGINPLPASFKPRISDPSAISGGPSDLPALEQAVLEAEGRLTESKRRREAAQAREKEAARRKQIADEGQVLLLNAAKMIQQQLEYQISDLVTAAMQAVFPRPYEFALEFVEARGRTEARARLRRGGVEIEDPLAEMGGGVVDVVAFALRVAMWSLAPSARRPLPVLLLDEPFRFLSADLRARAAMLLRELCERLNLQIIMVTHEPTFIAQAVTVHKLDMGANGRTRLLAAEGGDAPAAAASAPAPKRKRTRG